MATNWELAEKIRQLELKIAALQLTPEERAAVEYVELTLRCEAHPVCERHTAVLRGLLERLR